ncbi:methyl-accepting chemotaxis protein [Thaumasiovibrio sp. DFM-14]|uniref:methyl-accepting chemotaxis protein n=1 Tax=Thaumasiovibrio sp. DFM-14 TaxID=3384792 RepID=UPI0039A35B87
MNQRRQPSIIFRMNIGFVFLVLVFVATTYLMQRSSKEIYQQLNTVNLEAYPLLSKANLASVRLLAADKVFKDFLTTQDPSRMEAYQQQFSKAEGEFQQSRHQLSGAAAQYTALSNQLIALEELENTYFTEAKLAIAHYQNKLFAAQERAIAVRRFQILYSKLHTTMQSYINDSDNIAVQMLAKSYFAKLEQTEITTSDALASEDATIVEQALRDNKRSVTQLNYAFNGIVRQAPEIGEAFQESVDQYTRDIGHADGILEQHFDYLVADQQLYANIAILAAEVDRAMIILDTFVTEANTIMLQALTVAESNYSDGNRRALLFGTLAILLCTITGWYLSTRIRTPLTAVLATLEQLTQGNMTQRCNSSHFQEFEQLSGHINTLAQTLQQIIRDLAKTSQSLSHVATENQSITSNAQQQLKEQGERIVSVATAMTEMDHSVKDVSQNAEVTKEKVHSVEVAADAGRNIMSRSISTTQQLSSRIDESVGAVNQLQEMSHTIGSILDVIRNIADQTNLLALNAAIEAARAGEQGRGFAVVADEVRVLASKTTSSTEEIEGMIQRLQQGSSTAATMMASCVKEMENSSSQASDANSAMEEILSLILEISEMSSQISQAANEQANTSSDIARSLEDISHIADTNHTAMTEVASASEQLDELAHTQSHIVNRFTV